MSNSDQEIVYGNVGVLDIRKATRESVAGIRRIGNLGLLVYAPQTASLATSLSVGNLGSSVEAPAHSKLEMGSVRLNATALRSRTRPISMIVMGPLTLDADVTVTDVEEGVEQLVIMGPVTCPDSLVAVLQSKCELLMGPVDSYPAGGTLVVASGSLRLNRDTLSSMEDHSTLIVHGRLVVTDPLPTNLLERKLRSLKAHGSVLCSQENASVLRALLQEQLELLKLVPAGFQLVERALAIDSALLRFSAASKLYCSQRMIVDRAVSASEIEQHLEGLRCADLILAPAALRDALAPKCDLINDQVLFYEGELWLEEASSKLTEERFAYLDGVATLFVDAALEIDAGVTPELLAGKLAQVHNFGTITCTPAQMSALRARLGRNEGMFIDSSQPEIDQEDANKIGNIGYLAL